MKSNTNEKLLKDAQYRKGLSIAFFNATNAAISLITTNTNYNGNNEQIEDAIEYWRNWFITEHDKYYSEVIANVGLSYDREKAINLLKNTKTIEELKKVWISFSEDERQDSEIIKAKDKKKESL